MADTDENYILDAWEKRICPTCGAIIADERAYGSGRIKDGRFCSLACYGKYHEAAIAKRANEALTKARRKVN
jgi:hypothetical protein